MNCTVCHRSNLPGGVRCSYCGAPFAAAPDFDLGIDTGAGTQPSGTQPSGAQPSGAQPSGAQPSGAQPSGTLAQVTAEASVPRPAALPNSGPRPTRGKGTLGGLVGLIAFAAVKGKALLSLPKLGAALVTLASMFVAIWAYQLYFGWPFSIGLVFCILIHELGHVAVNRRWGLKASPPMFIPFLGAVILINRFPNNPRAESESGAGGPIGGLIASVVCAAIWLATRQPLWMGLAYISFSINLFNLLPVWQLDGAHISAVFSPANWYFVMFILLLWAIKVPSPMVWIVLVVALFVGVDASRKGRYQMVTPGVRLRMVFVYLGLCLSLALGTNAFQTTAGPYIDHLKASGRGEVAAVQTGASSSAATGPATHGVASSMSTSSDRARQQRKLRIARERQRLHSNAVILWAALVMIAYHFWWEIWILSSAGWLLVTFLLTRASGDRFTLRAASLAGWMCGLCGLIYALSRILVPRYPGRLPLEIAMRVRFLPLEHAGMVGLFCAFLMAEAAALVFAATRAARRRKGPKTPFSRLVWRCLAWMAGAALLASYWLENLWAFVFVVVGAAVFFGMRRWLVFSIAAQVRDRMGDPEGAIVQYQRALALGPDPVGTADQWAGIARANHILGRGERTLEALDHVSAGRPAPESGSALEFQQQGLRVDALTQLDRFDEALRYCEAMLRVPEGDQVGLWRPVFVHSLLGQMALYRGWYDEAIAQANCVLGSRVPKGQAALVRNLVASAHSVRARANAALGRYEEALADSDRVSQLVRTPLSDSQAALARAQVALGRGDAADAERETADAMRVLPGNLQVRYWRGRALQAAGRTEEAAALLRHMAEEFPRHHWASMAMREEG